MSQTEEKAPQSQAQPQEPQPQPNSVQEVIAQDPKEPKKEDTGE